MSQQSVVPEPKLRRRGFTLIELLLTVVVFSILLLILSPQISRLTTRAKVNEAAGIVAADLEQAVALAGRIHRPVTLSLASDGHYTVRDRAASPADTVRLNRVLGFASDQGVGSLTLSPSTVTIFPNGVVSAALTVTLAGSGHARQVTLSPAGLVRIVP